ncbi:MAG: hypothetical protein ACE37E_02350 [Hyphomicrobiales bacterium]
MIDEVRKVLALSALLSVLVAALFMFGNPVQAQNVQAQDVQAQNAQAQGAPNAQNQQNILSQAATTQGVPTLDGTAQADPPVDVSGDSSQD